MGASAVLLTFLLALWGHMVETVDPCGEQSFELYSVNDSVLFDLPSNNSDPLNCTYNVSQLLDLTCQISNTFTLAVKLDLEGNLRASDQIRLCIEGQCQSWTFGFEFCSFHGPAALRTVHSSARKALL